MHVVFYYWQHGEKNKVALWGPKSKFQSNTSKFHCLCYLPCLFISTRKKMFFSLLHTLISKSNFQISIRHSRFERINTYLFNPLFISKQQGAWRRDIYICLKFQTVCFFSRIMVLFLRGTLNRSELNELLFIEPRFKPKGWLSVFVRARTPCHAMLTFQFLKKIIVVKILARSFCFPLF